MSDIDERIEGGGGGKLWEERVSHSLSVLSLCSFVCVSVCV